MAKSKNGNGKGKGKAEATPKAPKVDEAFEKAKATVRKLAEAGKDDDDIVVALINEGTPFKKAGAYFAKAMTELGYRVSAKDRKEAAEGLIQTAGNPADWDACEALIKVLVANIDDTTERQAYSLIRRYAKDNEWKLPRKPGGGGSQGIRGLRKTVYDWLLANPKNSDDQFKLFCEEHEMNAGKVRHYGQIRQLVFDARK